MGYVKKNFLNGLNISCFDVVNPAAKLWLDTVANVRLHGETRRRPCDLHQEELPHLKPVNPHAYDYARTSTSVASSQFRVTVDTNQYSVPADFAHRRLLIKTYPDRVCIYFDTQLIASHERCTGKHQDVENPEHVKAVLEQRHRAREQRLVMRFLALSGHSGAYLLGLKQKHLNYRHHLRKILALSDIYPVDQMDLALQDGLAFGAFSADYLANILEMRTRKLPEAGPLHMVRHQDLLELEISPPDLTLYGEA